MARKEVLSKERKETGITMSRKDRKETENLNNKGSQGTRILR
jgi:hypothetical protein